MLNSTIIREDNIIHSKRVLVIYQPSMHNVFQCQILLIIIKLVPTCDDLGTTGR